MGALDQIVNIQISQQTAAVPQEGFGVPLIMGPSDRFSDIVRYYTDPADMLTDGFLTSDPEYVRCVEAFDQDLQPTQVGIGKYTAAVAQVETITPNVSSQAIQHYIITINGVPYDFTSDSSPTAAEVVAGLIALINADMNCPFTGVGTTTLVLTAKQAGNGGTFVLSSNLAGVTTTANHGIVTDIVALQAVSDIWYGLSICSVLAADLEQVAAYIETQLKIFIGVTGDAPVKDPSSTTDVGYILKGKAFKRTALIYSANPHSGLEASWLGGVLPTTPGSSTWKFKGARGVTPDKFSQGDRNALIGQPGTPGKNVNIFETVGGQNIFEEGFMCGGQFIDITVGIDWLKSTMQNNVFALLVQNEKIPYTDIGAAIIENAVRQTLKQGDDDTGSGLIDHTSIVVSAAPVLSQPTADRANRIYRGINWSCRLAGAFHFIVIKGVVTV